MKPALYTLLVLVLVAVGGTRSSCQEVLKCSLPKARPDALDEDFIQPMSKQETAMAKQSPHGVRRLGRHTLEVGWANGKHLFKDKPPYDEPLDGIHWTYCGYNSGLKLHMLLKEDEALFTGALLDDETGAVLPGGQKILFSKNAEYYLAYEQPDGQDGETIKLFRRNGALLWKGYNGFLSADGISVITNFDNMHWDVQNRLQADVQLHQGRKQTVTLTRSSAGKWEWLPPISK